MRNALSVIPVLLLFAVPSQSQRGVTAPTFEDYPVRRIYRGRNARPRLNSPDARLFRTRIREAAKDERPNFAGRIILTQWGCGTSCLMFAMMDAPTGRVYFSGFSVQWSHGIDKPLEFRPDSRLLVVRGMRNEDGKEGEYYYTFRNGRLSPVR